MDDKIIPIAKVKTPIKITAIRPEIEKKKELYIVFNLLTCSCFNENIT
jgi:hypothetical protein